MLVKPIRHIEQVVGSILVVCQNKNLLSPSMRGLMVESGTNICRATLLTGLENEHPRSSAVALRMVLDLNVQIPLHPVEEQRLDFACLGADLQAASGVVLQVVAQTQADRTLAIG